MFAPTRELRSRELPFIPKAVASTRTLRPVNATAPNAADHIDVLDAAIVTIPTAIAWCHHEGDERTPFRRVIARADNARCTFEFLAACRASHVKFSVTARSNAQLQS